MLTPTIIRATSLDRDPVSVASLFRRAKKLERTYASRLRKIARHVGDLVAGVDLGADLQGSATIRAALHRYSEALDPWAAAVADRMVTEVAAADREAWRRMSTTIGRLLHKEIETAPTGLAMRESKARQVGLIKSLPLDAAERVLALTTEGVAQGRRTSAIADDIMRSGDVARSRADLIARTEVARTATEMTNARAEHIGSTHFVWRTVHDGSVRPSHRRLDGQAFRWDAPPECDPGHHALPGAIWNCRCFPEPLIGSPD